MKEKKPKLLNTLLAIGMLAVFCGYLMVLAFAGTFDKFVISSGPILLFLSGLVFLYVYMAFSRTPFKLFCGTTLTLYGMFSLLLVTDILNVSISKLWPVFLILTAVALVAAGRSTGKRFSVKYDLTSILFFVIGLTLLLFSFKIISVSFKEFMLIAGPIVLIVFGIVLIILVLRRKNLLEILPDELSSELNREESLSGDYSE